MDEKACTVSRIKIRDGQTKEYLLEFVGYEGRGVVMTFPDLVSKRRFQGKTMKVFDQLIDPPPREDLNRLLREAEHIPTSSSLKRVK